VTKEDIAKFKAMEGEQQRRRLRPSDAELLDDDALPEDRPLLAEAKRLKAESERDEEDTPRAGKSAPQAAAPGAKTPVAPAAATATAGGGPLDSFWSKNSQQKPAGSRPETYVVQPGDTLFKIAKRFYGSANKWRDIREANKAVISSDGRVKVGQEIRLP
jgi:nucleoid-associated protein YgaU